MEILDTIERESDKDVKIENRAYNDLRIVLGITFFIVSLVLLYASYAVISGTITRAKLFDLDLEDINWFRVIVRSSPGLIYGSYFFVGAIGLFRRSTWGWAAGLSISFFALLFPLLVFIRDLILSIPSSSPPFWGPLLVLLLFGLVAFYFLLKPTRNIFNPTPKSYIFVFVSVCAMIVHLYLIPIVL